MSARWQGEEALLQPITPEQPCGDNLEDTELLSSFDRYGLFRQARPIDTAEQPPGSAGIRDKANDALRRSKDLRLLAHLGAALLRTDGIPAFTASLNVASQWLETYWPHVYPLVDEDAIYRRNVLNYFA